MTNQKDINLSQIKLGDKKVFDNIFRQFYTQLCIYSAKFLNDIETSEEIVQDVFVKLWENRENIEVQQSIKAYLYKSVHNSCLNYIKHEKVKLNYQTKIKNTELDYYEPIDEVESTEQISKIYAAIERLPIERQKVFKMSRFEGLKYKEIAEQLNISIKTVENQMGGALKFLREELAEFISIFLLIVIKEIFF